MEVKLKILIPTKSYFRFKIPNTYSSEEIWREIDAENLPPTLHQHHAQSATEFLKRGKFLTKQI